MLPLEKNILKKVNLGSEKKQMKISHYKEVFSRKFSIKINGQSKTMTLLSKEMKEMLICYLSIGNS
jgi:hypothetical protein